MNKKEITLQELLALVPEMEPVEIKILGVEDSMTGYAVEFRELCKTPYIVQRIYSYYSCTIIEVDI